MKLLLVASFILISQLSHAVGIIEPKIKSVNLKETTVMTLPIMPDSGTRLVFPFKLDNPELNPRLKIKLTNSVGFDVPDTKDELLQLVDQNTMTITGLRHQVDPSTGLPPVFRGTLYISIGGYNITINLRTSHKPKNQITDVVFKISDADRTHMVEQAIDRHTEMLNKDHAQKLKDIDDRAREFALGYIGEMALKDPDHISFKIEGDLIVGTDRVTTYIEDLISFNDRYFVFVFDLENQTAKDFVVSSWQLSGKMKEGDSYVPVQGQFHCRDNIKSDSDYRCSFSTLDPSIKEFHGYKLKMTADRGEGIVEW